MGKARRLWHRLRGGYDATVQLADDAARGSGSHTHQPPAVGTSITGSDLDTEPGGKDTAKEIWIDAYKRLENDDETKEMVHAYENLLSNQLDGSNTEIGLGTTSSISGRQTPEDKISDMRRVTESTMEKASRHKERKEGFVKAAKVMSTISSAIIKPMLQTEAVASIAWAGVCVALEFSIRATTAGLDMVDGLCHVAKRMEWYMVLHAVLLEKAQSATSIDDKQRVELYECLRKNIEELYYSLLLYQVQCVCYCYRDNHIIKMLRALVTLDDWKGRLSDIKGLESRIQMDMSLFTHTQTYDRLNKIARLADQKFDGIDRTLKHLLEAQEQSISAQDARHLQGLVGLLNTSDYNRHMKLNPPRVQGTCEWFCNHETFKAWLRADTGLLLVSADPGCGKSTLARYLIEDVLPQQKAEGKVLYFFFKDTNEQKRLNTALCATLHQLLLDENPLVSRLEGEMIQAGKRITENSSNLWKLFSMACNEFSGGIICVFDALDECDPQDCPELIGNIKSMLESGKVVRFLITTRGYPRLLHQFKTYKCGLIHLDGDGKDEKDAIEKEISLVLDYKLEQLSKTKSLDQQPERKAAIEKALRTKSSQQRTYLWLNLVFDIMERIPWKSDSDWKKVIMSPPQTVNDAYATLLQNVPEDEKASVKVLLHLIVAAYRPLTLREMSIAMIVRDSPGARDEKSLGLQPETEFKDWIHQTCGFFVTVYNRELYFIHQTAKEFLVGSGPDTVWPQVLDWFSPVTNQAAARTMAESSIAYLALDCFNSRQFQERAREHRYAKMRHADVGWVQLEKSLHRDYEFLHYTTQYWARHFRQCQSFDNENFEDIGEAFISQYINLFIHNPGWVFLVQAPILDVAPGKEVDIAGRYNVCDAALFLDHGRLLVYSFEHDVRTERSLLHTSAELNSINCVQYLAAKGFDINAQDEDGGTALCFAARYGAKEMMNKLLDHNADVNLGPSPDELPLSYILQQEAETPGYPELVRRIVTQGADLNNTRVKDVATAEILTPLARASTIQFHTSTHNDNITRLDDWIRGHKGASGIPYDVADLFQQLDIFAEAAFVTAYEHSLVKLLLDHGANIDDTIPNPPPDGHDPPGPMTALDLASFRISQGYPDHVFWNAMFLLHGGANSRLRTETGHSAIDRLLRARVEVQSMRVVDGIPGPLGCWYRWEALATVLLKRNPASDYINKPISNTAMQTRLHSLAKLQTGTRRYEKAKLLLDHGAEINCQDVYGKTPMHYLVSHTSWESEVGAVIEMLIAKGAELEVPDSLGRTPMHYVRSPVVLDILVKHGADIEARDQGGNTPLQSLLAGYSDVAEAEMIQSLIAIGADVTVSNSLGETLVHTAAKSGFSKGLSSLLRGLESLDVTDDKGETPLQAALHHRSYKVAALLLGKGAADKPLLQRNFDTEQRDRKNDATLLAFLSGYHFHGAARTLLRRGADPNALPRVGAAGIASRYLDPVERRQTDNNWFFKPEMGETRALRITSAELLRYEHADYSDERPLHLALHNQWTRDAEITMNLLLEHGADIEAKSALGLTPLQVACHRGNEEGARFLLEMGANVDCTTWDGVSALDLVCSAWQPNPALVRLLLTHSEKWYSKYHDRSDLCGVAARWLNIADGAGVENLDAEDNIHCRRQAKLDGVSHDESELATRVLCSCPECCRDHESRACTVAQILLDAGAWTQFRNQQRNVCFSPVGFAKANGWTDLTSLLEQAALPSWQCAWLAPNARRRSLPVPTLASISLRLGGVSEGPGNEMFVDYASTTDSLHGDGENLSSVYS